ncbi:MAG: hypothetical protein WAU36_19755 [Cyclobacteriaceae bacterium]
MSDCQSLMPYNSSHIIYDHCKETYSISVNNNKFSTKEALIQISDDCFELCKGRLDEDSDSSFFGRSIYDDLKYRIIDLAVEFDLNSFGFSISLEPSLHFIVRFKRGITLFFETYLDSENELETYVQIYEDKELILSIRDTISNGLFYVDEVLQEILSSRTLQFQLDH